MKKLITLLMISALFILGGCFSEKKEEKKVSRANSLYANFQKLTKGITADSVKRAVGDRPPGVYFVHKTTGATKFYSLDVLTDPNNATGLAFMVDMGDNNYNVFFVYNNRAGSLSDPTLSLNDFDTSNAAKTTPAPNTITAPTVNNVTSTGAITITTPEGIPASAVIVTATTTAAPLTVLNGTSGVAAAAQLLQAVSSVAVTVTGGALATTTASVTAWTAPADYSATTPGQYTFTATLSLPTGVTNPNAVAQKAVVTVQTAVISVSSLGSIIDYKTFKVTLTDTLLTLPTVTVNRVTAGGVAYTTFTTALTTGGIVLTANDSFAADTYVVTVSGSSISTTSRSAIITKDASAVNSFTLVTTGLGPIADSKIYFKAFDQYNQEVTSDMLGTVTALYTSSATGGTEGMPLVTSYSAVNMGNYFQISDTLIAGNYVKVVMVKGSATRTFYLTVTGTNAAVTSITGIKVGAGTTITNAATFTNGTTSITLSAVVIDQYLNEIALGATDKLRWVISKTGVIKFATTASGVGAQLIGTNVSTTSVDGLPTTGAAITSTSIGTTGGTQKQILVETVAEGEVTVTVFLPGGKAVGQPLLITVGKGSLKTITVVNSSFTVTNLTDSAIAKNVAVDTDITFKNEMGGIIPVKASAVTFTIATPAGISATAAELTITSLSDTNGYLTGMKITSARLNQTTEEAAGTYTNGATYTVTVVSTGADSKTFTVKTVIDNVVKTITGGSITAQELPAGGSKTIGLSFFNKFGEKLNMTKANVQWATTIPTTGSFITMGAIQKTSGSAFVDATAEADVVTGIKIMPSSTVPAKADYQLTITAPSASVNILVPVVSGASPATLTISSSALSIIANDYLDAATPSGTDNILLDTDFTPNQTFNLFEVVFKDQYGNGIVPNINTYSITTSGITGLEAYVYGDSTTDGSIWANVDGSSTGGATTNLAIKYIAVRSTTTAAAATGTLTVKLLTKANANPANGEVKATVGLTTTAERTLNTLAISPVSSTVLVGSTKNFTITGTDQYSRAIGITASSLKMVANAAYTATIGAIGTASASVTVTAISSSPTTYTAVFYYDTDSDNVKDDGEKSVNLALKISEAVDVISRIEITTSVAVSLNPASMATLKTKRRLNYYTVDVSKYNLEVPQSRATQHTYTVKAYDVNNQEINVNPSQFTWTILATNVSPSSITVVTTGSVNVFSVSVGAVTASGSYTVKAVSANQKEATRTVNIDNTASAAKAGTYVVSTDSSDYQKAVTSTSIAADNSTGEILLHILAIDQYGDTYKSFDERTLYQLARDDIRYFDIYALADGIHVYGKALTPATLPQLTVYITSTTPLTPVAITVAKLDTAAPTFTSTTITAIGGTVVTGYVNLTNTNLTATAIFTTPSGISGQGAIGGKVELVFTPTGGTATVISTSAIIAEMTTSVAFNLGASSTATLKAILTTNGAVTLKIYDSVGNNSSSSVCTVDYLAPSTPTAIALTAIGGTVTATGILNGTNTNLTASAVIIAGDATGGYAELLFTTTVTSITTVISTSAIIGASDTKVNFNLNTTTTGGLQNIITTSGTITVKIYDAAKNITTATAITITADYIITTPTAVTFTAIGGTLKTSGGAVILNGTNTNLTASAIITAGDATGGYAELVFTPTGGSATVISTSAIIGAADVKVSFDLGTSTTTGLQNIITLTGGTITVKLYDAVRNVVTATAIAIVADYVAPNAPNTVTFSAIGGTVMTGAGIVNGTNTNLTASAIIGAGDAPGGYAELVYTTTGGLKVIATSAAIGAIDTNVTFDLGGTATTSLQAIITTSGTLSVVVIDAAGNRGTTSSTVTVTADYIAPSAPTSVTFAAIGGVKTSSGGAVIINGTNTSITATAIVVAGQATGGKATLSFTPTGSAVTTVLTTITSISAADTTLTFSAVTLAGSVITTSGTLVVTVWDIAGNYSTSSALNLTYAPIATSAAIANVATENKPEATDIIVITFSDAMNVTSMGTTYSALFKDGQDNIIYIYQGNTTTAGITVAAITLTAGDYCDVGDVTFIPTAINGVWSNSDKTLTIALGAAVTGIAQVGLAYTGSSIVLYPGAIDAIGNTGMVIPVADKVNGNF